MQNLRMLITFPLQNPELFKIESNIKKDQLVNVLSTYVRSQFGKSFDLSKANIKDVYTIEINLDLSCDVFKVHSDTGNKNATLGILIHVLKMLSEKYERSHSSNETING